MKFVNLLTKILLSLFIGIIIGGAIFGNKVAWVTGIVLLVIDIFVGIIANILLKTDKFIIIYVESVLKFLKQKSKIVIIKGVSMKLYRDYENKSFYSNLKYARRMFLVATIISLLMLIVDIVYLVFQLSGSVFLEWNISVVIYYCCIAYFYPVIMYISFIIIKKSPLPETEWHNDYSTLRVNAVGTFLPLIFSFIFVIFYACLDSQVMLDCLEMIGRMLIEYIFLAIGSGFLYKSAIIAKHDLVIHPPEYKHAEIEQKQAEQRILNEKKNLQNYRDLVDVAGKKFTLKITI